MNELLGQLGADPWGRLVLHYTLMGGLLRTFLFVLVGARLAGLLLVAPCIMTIAIPFRVRVALVVLFAMIIAPTVLPVLDQTHQVTLTGHDTSSDSGPIVLPDSVTDLVCAIASEVGLGALLGVGVLAIFSGLQLAGEWLDRHSGLGLGAVFNPDWSAGGGSACGSLVRLLGCAAFLLAEPTGGYWHLLQSLLQSFQAIPIGTTFWSMPCIDLLNGVVQQCLILGIRVAMPLVAVMTLVDVTLALANRGATTAESSNQLVIRVAVGLMVLALTTTAIPDSIAQAGFSAIQFVGDLPGRQ